MDRWRMQCSRTLFMSLWTKGEARKGFMAETRENLKLLEEQLDGKRFFGGDSVGYLDVAVSALAWLPVHEEMAGVRVMSDEEYPALCRWVKEYTSDDAVNKCLPSREQIISYYAPMKDKFELVAMSWLQK
ncbi:hypothetical protein ABZP36_015675 [Zizania latifolia]